MLFSNINDNKKLKTQNSQNEPLSASFIMNKSHMLLGANLVP